MKTLLLVLSLTLPASAGVFETLLALPQSAVAWHPTNISTLISDWDASNYTTNAGVARLTDTWSGYHLTNAAGATAPWKTNAAIAGYPAIVCDGTDDNLRAESYTNKSAFTHEVWMVVLVETNGFLFDGISARHVGNLFAAANTYTNQMFAGSTVKSGDNSRTNVWHVRRYVFDGATSRLQTNGVTECSGNAGSNACAGFSWGVSSTFSSAGRHRLTRMLSFSATNTAANALLISNYLSRYGPF